MVTATVRADKGVLTEFAGPRLLDADRPPPVRAAGGSGSSSPRAPAMPDRLLSRLRGLLQFAILWLMVVYLIEALRGAVVELGGLLVVLVASAVVTYCKWRAQRGLPVPENRLAYYFWTYLPSVPAVASAGGIVYKIARRGEETTAGGFWGVLWDLLPTALEFGVPIVALCWAYVLLVRGVATAARAAGAPPPEPKGPAAAPPEATP